MKQQQKKRQCTRVFEIINDDEERKITRVNRTLMIISMIKFDKYKSS